VTREDTQDSTALANHWWWRPGWGPGTRYLTWHLTFQHAPALVRHARAYQPALAPFSTLDVVEGAWLHLTLAGVGHADQVDAHQLDRIIDRVRTAAKPRVALAFDRVVVGDEAVALVARPSDELDRLRRDLATATWDVLGDGAPRADPHARFAPHVSLAYANATQAAAPVRAALDTVARTCAIASPTLSLIELRRDDQAYQWRTVLDL
jgi:2'-5' RNA ligase